MLNVEGSKGRREWRQTESANAKAKFNRADTRWKIAAVSESIHLHCHIHDHIHILDGNHTNEPLIEY